MPKSSVYTRTGDKGETSLFSGERVSKNNDIITALGNNDELTSYIGLAMECCRSGGDVLGNLVERFEWIQCRLQEINSSIATIKVSQKVTFSTNASVRQLELWIDELDSELPKLSVFILPVLYRMDLIVLYSQLICIVVWWDGKRADPCCKGNL